MSRGQKIAVVVVYAVLLTVCGFFWSIVLASEHAGSTTIEVGLLGQVNVRHFSPSIGLYGLMPLTENIEIHASVWDNPVASTGGIGAGTLHRASGMFWVGWEAALDIEHDGALVYGLGPVLELEILQHRLHTFLKVPIEYGHEFGWATVAGLNVAIWH